MSEWLPIETAPKDGTPVLLWGVLWPEVWPKHTDPTMVIGSCQNGVWYMDNTECYSTMIEPTGWMPRPTPPTSPAAPLQSPPVAQGENNASTSESCDAHSTAAHPPKVSQTEPIQ